MEKLGFGHRHDHFQTSIWYIKCSNITVYILYQSILGHNITFLQVYVQIIVQGCMKIPGFNYCQSNSWTNETEYIQNSIYTIERYAIIKS